MKLEHITGMQAGYSMGADHQGREYLVVCVKGTYTFFENGQPPRLAQEQLPLVEADIFTGEPGLSAPLYESDYARIKPRCDVLLNGSAYAPGGIPAAKVPVMLQFGRMKKQFVVVGDRVWESKFIGPRAKPPTPFISMPITYDRAFGGVDDYHQKLEKVRAVMENPVGVGFHHYISSDAVNGKPLPNTEEFKKPVKSPSKRYRPMSFGPIGRGWQPRAPLAGTYDQNWTDNIFPFLPPDFKNDYFQAASFDQQVPYPQGGEPVVLYNLTPEGKTWFPFPRINLIAWFFLNNGDEKESPLIVDTVMLEPDEKRFTVTSRTSLPLNQNMLEMQLVVVGKDPDDKQKVIGDTQIKFPLIDEFIEKKMIEHDEETRDD
ncbi:MAG: DUF2169 domain-containing protein [Desulfobacteraceae bacterium]|nr:DUF2169 domain-containing protein [Desulfobacteraceae bacterium]